VPPRVFRLCDARFTPKSGHVHSACLLCAKSGHCEARLVLDLCTPTGDVIMTALGNPKRNAVFSSPFEAVIAAKAVSFLAGSRP
jgi:hypothetical protein